MKLNRIPEDQLPSIQENPQKLPNEKENKQEIKETLVANEFNLGECEKYEEQIVQAIYNTYGAYYMTFFNLGRDNIYNFIFDQCILAEEEKKEIQVKINEARKKAIANEKEKNIIKEALLKSFNDDQKLIAKELIRNYTLEKLEKADISVLTELVEKMTKERKAELIKQQQKREEMIKQQKEREAELAAARAAARAKREAERAAASAKREAEIKAAKEERRKREEEVNILIGNAELKKLVEKDKIIKLDEHSDNIKNYHIDNTSNNDDITGLFESIKMYKKIIIHLPNRYNTEKDKELVKTGKNSCTSEVIEIISKNANEQSNVTSSNLDDNKDTININKNDFDEFINIYNLGFLNKLKEDKKSRKYKIEII